MRCANDVLGVPVLSGWEVAARVVDVGVIRVVGVGVIGVGVGDDDVGGLACSGRILFEL